MTVNLDEAITYCQKAIAMQPDLAAAYWNLGKVLEQQGWTNEGLIYQEKALNLEPDIGQYGSDQADPP